MCAALTRVHAGGGRLNSFGRAFRDHEYTWTRELCEEDSDGDGLSNGTPETCTLC